VSELHGVRKQMANTRSEGMIFPKGFLWGAATSAYQIEGAWTADGKAESIWDHFAHTAGNIITGETGDTACDHYHRWPEDVSLMKSIGLSAYRFSIAWPRILPYGRGTVNQKGLDFYSRLVDSLLEADIVPFVTLFHWDLPQALQNEGGFAARSTAEAFVAFADVVSRCLGDRVSNWITHNEPSVFAYIGHKFGSHAPGLRDAYTALRVAHHLLLSHGWSVPVIRANCAAANVGIAMNVNYNQPASASRCDYAVWQYEYGMWTRWFLDPLYGRDYPPDLVRREIEKGELPGSGLDFVEEGDLAAIAVPTDFLGINYYTRQLSRDNSVPEEENLPVTAALSSDDAENWQEMEGWEVYPEGLFNVLSWLYFEYQPQAIYITENGASWSDAPDNQGRVKDTRRIRFLERHLLSARRAIQSGIPLRGYFAWSLLDNFEWGYGFKQRFGLVWVDFETQKRILKDSALWYRDLIHKDLEAGS